MVKRIIAQFFMKAAKLLDEPHLNSSLCLIFNGMASMAAIVFIVLFVIGKTEPLLVLGIAGCICMTLANTTDMFPFWLNSVARKIGRSSKA